MTIKHIPAREDGITTIPARDAFSNPLTADEQTEMAKRLSEICRPRAFEDVAGPTERVARRIIERTGGRYVGDVNDVPLSALATGSVGLFRSGEYAFETRPAPASEQAFALHVLSWIQESRRHVRAGNVAGAMVAAWNAASYATEAHMKFKWEPLALRGMGALASTGTAWRAKRDRSEKDGAALTRRFDTLRAEGYDVGAAYLRIADELQRGKLQLRTPIKPTRGAIAAKIQRYRKLIR